MQHLALTTIVARDRNIKMPLSNFKPHNLSFPINTAGTEKRKVNRYIDPRATPTRIPSARNPGWTVEMDFAHCCTLL
jgi:hypothetical protein